MKFFTHDNKTFINPDCISNFEVKLSGDDDMIRWKILIWIAGETSAHLITCKDKEECDAIVLDLNTDRKGDFVDTSLKKFLNMYEIAFGGATNILDGIGLDNIPTMSEEEIDALAIVNKSVPIDGTDNKGE